MAFNPFAGFAKYKRFWMATLLLVTMITFVLCTGVGGDLSDRLLRLFRPRGTPMATIDGSSITNEDLYRLKLQRNVANDYMRIYARLVGDAITERLKNVGEVTDDNAKRNLQQVALIQRLLGEKLKTPRFFDSGVKAEDLVSFRAWLAEADRMGINLQAVQIEHLINRDLFNREVLGQNVFQVEAKTLSEVRNNHGPMVNGQFVFKALEDEYRVRIAQLALAEYQICTWDQNMPKRIKPNLVLPSEMVRAPMSPGMLWEYFQENRKEFDVALLPIPVSAFTKDVPEPDQKGLEELFEKHKKNIYDPASDQPGFRRAQQIKVQWVSAESNAAFYKNIAQISNLMAAYPIGSFTPQFPLGTAIRFVEGPVVTNSALAMIYDFLSAPAFEGASNLSRDIAAPMATWLSRKEPLAYAAFLGAQARPDGVFAAAPAFFNVGAWKYPQELKEGIKNEARRRVPLYATVIASGRSQAGLLSLAELYALGNQRVRLPLVIVQKTLTEILEREQGSRWVSANMQFLKKKLEDDRVLGVKSQVDRMLDRYGPEKKGTPRPVGPDYRDLGLEFAQTEKFYDRYNIHTAPELKPLLESFERYYTTVNQTEGREMKPESVLKDEDFWKLFFDGSESFASAIRKHEAKPWPPVVKLGSPTQLAMLRQRPNAGLEVPFGALDDMIRSAQNRDPNKEATFNLFGTSDRPFLFWKVDEKQSEIPDSLAEVKDRVAEAWRFTKARDTKALPLAKSIAENLMAGNSDYASVLKQEGAKLGQATITLPRLAPMYFDFHFGGSGIYTNYKLPRNVISYPRDDMVTHILSLNDLKDTPVKTGIADIDAINSELFQKAKTNKLSSEKFVQILTNKPRDTFYVAVIQANLGANRGDFFGRVLPGAGFSAEDPRSDTFFDRAQVKTGEMHMQDLTAQIRLAHRVKVEDAIKTFDSNDGGQ